MLSFLESECVWEGTDIKQGYVMALYFSSSPPPSQYTHTSQHLHNRGNGWWWLSRWSKAKPLDLGPVEEEEEEEGVTLEYRRFYLIYLDILFVLVLYLPPSLLPCYIMLCMIFYPRMNSSEELILSFLFFYYSSSYIFTSRVPHCHTTGKAIKKEGKASLCLFPSALVCHGWPFISQSQARRSIKQTKKRNKRTRLMISTLKIKHMHSAWLLVSPSFPFSRSFSLAL